MRRFWLLAAILLTLLVWWPGVMFAASLVMAERLGCEVHEGYAQPCIRDGHDWGPFLYRGFVMGWFLMVTWPGMLLSLIAWLVWGVRRWRRG